MLDSHDHQQIAAAAAAAQSRRQTWRRIGDRLVSELELRGYVVHKRDSLGMPVHTTRVTSQPGKHGLKVPGPHEVGKRDHLKRLTVGTLRMLHVLLDANKKPTPSKLLTSNQRMQCQRMVKYGYARLNDLNEFFITQMGRDRLLDPEKLL